MRRIAIAVVLASALTACAAPRQTLGTRSSACFRSLPVARSAVRDSGRLVGVHRVKRATVLKAFPKASLPADRDFCAVGFSGDYTNTKVDKPAGAPIGKYAIVIVNLRGTTPLQTYLVDNVPFRLRHR